LTGAARHKWPPSPCPPASAGAGQLVLFGEFRPVSIPSELWRSWLADPDIVDRFESKRYRRDSDACWPWLGAVSSTGHGSFRAASLPGPSRPGTVPAHVFAYQLAHSVIPRLGFSYVDDPVVSHECDFAGCTNPNHLRLGTQASNRAEYAARRGDVTGPLADVRGAAGRTRAIAVAIRIGLDNRGDVLTIEKRIRAAENAGIPITLW
jgi:hypothetical protein